MGLRIQHWLRSRFRRARLFHGEPRQAPVSWVSCPDVSPRFISSESLWGGVLTALPFVIVWSVLLWQLGGRWYVYEEYAYGWSVLVISLALFWQRTRGLRSGDSGLGASTEIQTYQGAHDYSTVDGREPGARKSAALVLWMRHPVMGSLNVAFCTAVFVLCALLYLPTRIVQEELPNFRAVDWLLTLEAVGLTLVAIYLARGSGWVRQLWFPVCFILAAVPWPSAVEHYVIQGLATVDASVTAELLNWMGIPAVVHGRTIEISTGVVGVNDACSGIRSCQSGLMFSWLVGELLRLTIWRRVGLLMAALLTVTAFNIIRTLILLWVAAKEGVAAVAHWHDGTGIAITVTSFFALLGMGYGLKIGSGKRDTHRGNVENAVVSKSPDQPASHRSVEVSESACLNLDRVDTAVSPPAPRRVRRFHYISWGLLVWLLGVEIGARSWSYARQFDHREQAEWTIQWPKENPSLVLQPIDALSHRILGCDRAQQGVWSENDGSQWQVFLIEWFPGRYSRLFASRHLPEVCLPAAGFEMLSASGSIQLTVNGLRLPIRCYTFAKNGSLLYVFRWVSESRSNSLSPNQSEIFDVLRGAWMPAKDVGCEVLEIAVSGFANPEDAQVAVRRRLEHMIQIRPLTTFVEGP
jgi:exosortase